MADAPLTPEQPNLPESQCSEAGIYHHKRLVMLWSDAEAWAQAYGDACYAAGVEAGRTATPSPPVAAAPATPVAPTGWVTMWPTPRMPGYEPVYTHGSKKPSYGPELDALLDVQPVYAAAQPQPQPVQPLTGARPERCPSCRNGDLYSCTCPFPTSLNAGPPHPDTAQPLTADQRQDLLAAAFYIACRNEPGATLKDVDAERIADLLAELAGFDLARITAPSTPTPPKD